MWFWFKRNDDEGEIAANKAVMLVSIDPDFPVVKVEVDLYGLPNIMYGGHEVVMDFNAE